MLLRCEVRSSMAKPLLDDALWQLIEPILPEPKPRRKDHPGRRPISNRQAMTGILFVLKTGIPWEYLPQEMGCGSGMTCWRCLRDWQKAGVWERMHEALLQKLLQEGVVDLSSVAVDSSSVWAVGAGKNRSKPGRPTQGRLQASLADRCGGCAAGASPHRGQPPRCDSVDAPGGCFSDKPGSSWTW